jgi:hypothetical protein
MRTKITSIPSALLASNPLLSRVDFSFCECVLLTSIPNDLFDNNKNITTFDRAFYNNIALTGATPRGTDNLALWERAGQSGYPTSINGGECFELDTGLSDYDSIPTAWK